MKSCISANIVWIDDQFLNKKFLDKIKDKNISWNELFEKNSGRIYRLFDINFFFLSCKADFDIFIEDEKRFIDNSYYYFIVDRYLPLKGNNNDTREIVSKKIIRKLKNLKQKYKNAIDFCILSAASGESYSIKDIDYYIKPMNKDFHLPEELSNKILYLIKRKINLINLEKFNSKIEYDEKKEYFKKGNIFPFIDEYEDFVELSELSFTKYNNYFLVTEKSTNDAFIIQSLIIIFYEELEFHNYKLRFINLNESEKDIISFIRDFEIEYNNVLILRYDKWDIDLIKKIKREFKYIKYKVFIFDENENEDIVTLVEQFKNAKILKINNLDNKVDLAKFINYAFFNYIFSNKINEILEKEKNLLEKYIKSVFYKNNILLFHPIVYVAIINQEIKADNLNDPIELFNFIDHYLDLLNDFFTKKMFVENEPFEFDNKDKIYEKVEKIYQSKYQLLLKSTIEFWLNSSWNVNYNVKINENIEKWQKFSFELLKELLNKYKGDEFNNISKAIEMFEKIENEELDDITLISSIKWPHDKYPMPTYMVKKIKEKKSKILYLQNENFQYIKTTCDIKNQYLTLSKTLDYYHYIFDLVDKTKKYFPSPTIKNLEHIIEYIKGYCNYDEVKIKHLGETFIRIAYFFRDYTTNDAENIADNYDELNEKLKNKKKKNSSDVEQTYGELGILLGKYRGWLLKNIEKFDIDISNFEKETIEFLKKYKYEKSEKIDILIDIKSEEKYKTLVYDDSKSRDYIYNIEYANNVFQIAGISNINDEYSKKRLYVKLSKHLGAYSLLAFFTTFRNSLEHSKIEGKVKEKLFNKELLKEAFIYGYEYIWLYYLKIIQVLGDEEKIDNELYPKYIKLDINLKKENIKVKTLEEFKKIIEKKY